VSYEDLHESDAPPVSEEIHLPGPSLLPFLTAIAITLIVVGTTISLVISIIGLVALVIIVWRWVGDTRRDIAELPEEHVH
jgi:membrane protein implicated in regulation of membrane protease activity